MIGKLTGTIDEVWADSIILDVNGVGYLVYIPQNIIFNLKIGDKISFYIYTYIREDILKLYGFDSKEQIDWFLLLQDVPKIGAKVAFTILSTLTLEELTKAIAFEEDTTISKTPGVGKKVAMRIISELKNKDINIVNTADRSSSIKNNVHLDAISALLNLGYSKEQATKAVNDAIKESGNELDCSVLVKQSLKKLSSNK